jgi:hypothetical protein
MGVVVLFSDNILIHDTILQALLAICRYYLTRYSSSCWPVYFEAEEVG